MTVPDITEKLRRLIDGGIHDEAGVVYLLVSIRKLTEQEDLRDRFSYLRFHCDWALHARLDRWGAQNVLKVLDKAHEHLKAGGSSQNLPLELSNEFATLSQMKNFRSELDEFLCERELPRIENGPNGGWIYFQFLYVNVIAGCPLVVSSKNADLSIETVTVDTDLANEAAGNERFFRVNWHMRDKTGAMGTHSVYNSFSHVEKKVP
jgi:hypothetical protein